MSQTEKSKNIFQAAINAVSSRDEKAAIEAAMKEAEANEQRAIQAEQKAAQTAAKLTAAEQRATQSAQKLAEAEKKTAQLTTDLGKAQAELAKVRSELAVARNAVSAAETKLSIANMQLQNYSRVQQAEKAAAEAEASARAQIIAEHTLTADESLSHLALKYYGSAYEPYWRVIYEANKELIGENPARVRPGMVINILSCPRN